MCVIFKKKGTDKRLFSVYQGTRQPTFLCAVSPNAAYYLTRNSTHEAALVHQRILLAQLRLLLICNYVIKVQKAAIMP